MIQSPELMNICADHPKAGIHKIKIKIAKTGFGFLFMNLQIKMTIAIIEIPIEKPICAEAIVEKPKET